MGGPQIPFYTDSNDVRYDPNASRFAVHFTEEADKRAKEQKKHEEKKSQERKQFESEVLVAGYVEFNKIVKDQQINSQLNEAIFEKRAHEEKQRLAELAEKHLVTESLQQAQPKTTPETKSDKKEEEKQRVTEIDIAPALRFIQMLRDATLKDFDAAKSALLQKKGEWHNSQIKVATANFISQLAAFTDATVQTEIQKTITSKAKTPEDKAAVETKLKGIETALASQQGQALLKDADSQMLERMSARQISSADIIEEVPGKKKDFQTRYNELLDKGASSDQAYCKATMETSESVRELGTQIIAAGTRFEMFMRLDKLSRNEKISPHGGLFDPDRGLTAVRLSAAYANSPAFREATKSYYEEVTRISAESSLEWHKQLAALDAAKEKMLSSLHQAEHDLKKMTTVPTKSAQAQLDKIVGDFATALSSMKSAHASFEAEASASVPAAPPLAPGRP